MFHSLLLLPRYQKRAISLITDSCFLPVALWLAFSLRLDLAYLPSQEDFALMALTTSVSLLVFMRLGLYRAVIRYMSNQAMMAVFVGVSASALVLVLTSFLLQVTIPRSVPVIYWCIALVFVGGSRMLARSFVHRQVVKKKDRVVIYGAGKSGLQLSSVLFHGKDLQPVAFVDDDPKIQGTVLNGIRVYGAQDFQKVAAKYGAKRVLLALGSAPRSDRAKVISFLEEFPVLVQTIPDINDVVSGRAKIEEIRDVDIEDLLGRDEVAPDKTLLSDCITKKIVMVTGAGGSIGSELCRQIIRLRPSKLLLFELSEFALYQIKQDLDQLALRKSLSIDIQAVIGSVQNQERLAEVMSSFSVDTVYHAAAYKHVPLVEHNVVEGVRNNVLGTWKCAEAAIESNVDTFVLISTDKAVRPTNVMGATKRFAELVLQGLALRQNGTRFCMVRFGNVLGSSGSVVPLFRRQISEGGPVTVTHPDITRYFMTIPEAALLVLQAGSMGDGGEVFLLDMGESVRIADLAEKMIRLMGLEVRSEMNPEGEIEVVYTGLRPGEKLYEELLIADDPRPTAHPRILKAKELSLRWNEVEAFLFEVERLCKSYDCVSLRELLLRAPLGYAPNDKLEDSVWSTSNRSQDKSVTSTLMPANEDNSGANTAGEHPRLA